MRQGLKRSRDPKECTTHPLPLSLSLSSTRSFGFNLLLSSLSPHPTFPLRLRGSRRIRDGVVRSDERSPRLLCHGAPTEHLTGGVVGMVLLPRTGWTQEGGPTLGIENVLGEGTKFRYLWLILTLTPHPFSRRHLSPPTKGGRRSLIPLWSYFHS